LKRKNGPLIGLGNGICIGKTGTTAAEERGETFGGGGRERSEVIEKGKDDKRVGKVKGKTYLSRPSKKAGPRCGREPKVRPPDECLKKAPREEKRQSSQQTRIRDIFWVAEDSPRGRPWKRG